MGLDRAPIEFQTFYFFHVWLDPPIMPAITSSSRATPNVASGCNLLRQMDPRPKLPLSRLMQVQSWQRLKILAFHLQEVPPNVVISAEHALVATIPPTTKPSSPTTSGRAGSSSPEPETTPLDPQTLGTHSQPVEALSPGSSMDWSSGTSLASSSSKTVSDGDLQNPIVTISQRGTEAMSMLAPNITIEYRGPVPTFSTPLQPPVRINFLQNDSQYVNTQLHRWTSTRHSSACESCPPILQVKTLTGWK